MTQKNSEEFLQSMDCLVKQTKEPERGASP